MTSNYVLRGGSWIDYSGHCRSADCDGGTPDDRGIYLGFRVLRISREAEEEVKCRKEFLVVRGGGWLNYYKDCRSAYRRRYTPVVRFHYLGFRVLRSSEVDDKPRVLRGGCWFNNSGSCRSANRSRDTPDYRGDHLGFRVIKDTDV